MTYSVILIHNNSSVNTHYLIVRRIKIKGTILNFSIQANSGIISGDDQKRYSFFGNEWKENIFPQRGLKSILI